MNEFLRKAIGNGVGQQLDCTGTEHTPPNNIRGWGWGWLVQEGTFWTPWGQNESVGKYIQFTNNHQGHIQQVAVTEHTCLGYFDELCFFVKDSLTSVDFLDT